MRPPARGDHATPDAATPADDDDVEGLGGAGRTDLPVGAVEDGALDLAAEPNFSPDIVFIGAML